MYFVFCALSCVKYTEYILLSQFYINKSAGPNYSKTSALMMVPFVLPGKFLCIEGKKVQTLLSGNFVVWINRLNMGLFLVLCHCNDLLGEYFSRINDGKRKISRDDS